MTIVTSRSDVNRLSAAQRRLVTLAQGEIAGFFGTLDLTRPEAARDALLEITPLLVREYGDLAAVAAAEWYEEVRPGPFNARTAPMALDGEVAGSVRYAAGHLFGENPSATLSALSGSMQRFITYGGRATVARNVQLDPLKPRFARVPTGAKTCAWCAMLASRGFVYHSEVTAGMKDHWHDDCDCQAVVEFDRNTAHIEGYDPDRLYAMYLQAREASNGVTDKDIAVELRRMFPDEFTDGVHAA